MTKEIAKAELKLKTWLHIVARIKTIPKDYVCSEECEQHAIYGRLFSAHPLEKAKSEASDSDDSEDEITPTPDETEDGLTTPQEMSEIRELDLGMVD